MSAERLIPFHYVLINKILIGDRFRRDVGDLSEIRESIARNGLFHPIVIDDNLNLIAGHRRLLCCKELNWLEIPCHFKGELTELQRLEIELEENIARKDMSWDERVALRARIHEVKQALYGAAIAGRPSANDGDQQAGWSMQNTAELLGTSKPRISLDIAMAKILERLPQLKELDENEARRVIGRLIEEIERELSVRKATKIIENIWPGDCRTILRHLPDSSVDLILTDPPYGVELQSLANRDGDSFGHRSSSHFDDSLTNTQQLLREVLPELKRVLKPNGHIYLFFGITEYTWLYPLLCEFFPNDVDPIPLIWVKGKERWGTGDWEHKYARQYEGIMFVYSRQRRLNEVQGNVLHNYEPEEVKTSAQKPLNILQNLIKQSTNEGEFVLDPFAGSGSTLVAAAQLRRQFYGIELSESMYKLCKLRVQEVLDQQAREAYENEKQEQELEQEEVNI